MPGGDPDEPSVIAAEQTPRQRRATAAAAVTAALLMAAALFGPTTAQVAQLASNLGLTAVTTLAGASALLRAQYHSGSARRFWLLLGGGVSSWAAGQAVWASYELLGREVPFPSPADVGYLGLPPLVAAALLSLPLAAPTLAGRARTLLDGLLVAASLVLVSWIVVLGPVFRSGGDGGLLPRVISLAYPVGDVVVITLVLYTWLRARQLGRRLPVSLPLVGGGLVAFAVSDSGFVYLTTSGAYATGNVIDLGWFVGFALIAVAAPRGSPADDARERDADSGRPLGNLLPYAAVCVALGTSVVSFVAGGGSEAVTFWLRTAIMVLLVLRQVLTLLENASLTRHLERRVSERTAELRTREQRFAALVQHSSDLVTVLDRSGTVTYQSESSERVLGHRPADLVGTPLTDLMDAESAAAFLRAVAALQGPGGQGARVHELRGSWRHASGRRCTVDVTITNLLDNPDVGGLVLNSRDVTDRVELEEQLTHQAFTDSLTGLPNRALFKDRLQHALSRRTSAQAPLAVFFLDLDGFKAVNDTLGHTAGDELLVAVARRLRDVVRPSDTVARLGGDEFAVLAEEAGAAGAATDLAVRIAERLAEPVLLGGEPVHVAASVGIATSDPSSGADQLLRDADLAMYQAKATRSGSYAVYDPSMHASLVERVRLEADLRGALEREELFLHYQPLVAMEDGRISGVEALVRWQHPERGTVPPTDFIPLAETTGLIRPIGLWVLREACRQAVAWQEGAPGATGSQPLKMSVNLSGHQLLQPDLVEQVAAILAETGMPAHSLTLEMTETVLVEDSGQALAALTALRDLGVGLAIDDFGTGYSSLSYLHRFPFDTLKIDRSFVERLSVGGDATLVDTILGLAASMGLETVAEGIEDVRQLEVLRREGCTTGQGYHFSPPVPAADLTAMLAEQRAGGTSGWAGGTAPRRRTPSPRTAPGAARLEPTSGA